MRLCIVIPAWNEEKRIGKTLEYYGKFFDGKFSLDFDYEILVVINNCQDGTEDVVKKYQKKFKKIKYIRLIPGGKGFAITEGFREALKGNFDLIGFLDADMATSPEEYYRLLKNINNCDGIIASRWKRGAVNNYSLKRRIFSHGFNFVIRALLFLPYSDTQCGAKIFRKDFVNHVVESIGITAWAFDVNLLYLAKQKRFKINEVATTWEDKEGSTVNVMKDTFSMLSAVLRLRLINSPFNFVVRAYDKLPNKVKNGQFIK